MSVDVGVNVEEFQENLSSNYFNLGGDTTKKFSVDDLTKISDELERIINFVKNSTNIEYFIYDYPAILEEQLRLNVIELQTILREIKSVNLNIQRKKQQKILFGKEKVTLKKTLKKLKENEFREMETMVALFDKAMFARWENVKNTKNIDIMERFLSNITSKQVALDNLHTLAMRKLVNLNKQNIQSNSGQKGENISTLIPALVNNIEKPVIPPPPPLPDFSDWTEFSAFNLQSTTTEENLQFNSLHELD